MIREYEIGREIQTRVKKSPAKVVVFPEAVAASWTGELLQDANKIVVFGVTEPLRKRFYRRSSGGSAVCSSLD